MKLEVKTERIQFTVSRAPEAKVDQLGRPRLDRTTQLPLYVVELVGMDSEGAEVIKVSVPGQPPRLAQNQSVTVQGLVVVPWEIDGKHGVAYRADAVAAAKTVSA